MISLETSERWLAIWPCLYHLNKRNVFCKSFVLLFALHDTVDVGRTNLNVSRMNNTEIVAPRLMPRGFEV
jgi:hypothetical protein